MEGKQPEPSIQAPGAGSGTVVESERQADPLPPPFQLATGAPEAFRELWAGTVASYRESSIPVLLRETVLARLSRYSALPHCLIYHSAQLHSLGVTAAEVFQLISEPAAGTDELTGALGGEEGPIEDWPAPGSRLGARLVSAAEVIFLDPRHARRVQAEALRILGPERYASLVQLLGFARTCHHWLESWPEVSSPLEGDHREKLAALVAEEPRLDDFFRGYYTLFRRERQSVVELLSAEIPARLRAEEALRRSEERFRHLVEAVKDYSIIMLDPEGRVESWNAGAERIKGYRAEEIIGEHFSRFYPGEDVQQGKAEADLQAAREAGRLEVEGWRVRKDGTRFWANAVLTALRRGEGNLVGFACIIRDVTERRRAGEALARQAAELERSNVELLRSNRKLEEFAYLASHDLKEPLRGIHNFSSFLMEDYAEKLDEGGRTKLETLKRLSKRMEEVIEAVLHFSRLGKVDLAIGVVDLGAVVAEVLDSLGPWLKENGGKLRLPRVLPRVRCDRVGVTEVLRNLITNAVKYNDKAEKWVEIGWTPQGPADESRRGGGVVAPVLYVRDNGIGIPQKHFEVIFRMFKRLHTPEKYGGGAGVGLSLVKTIVERHGGRVWLESTVGEGTTFFFTLG